MHKSKFTLALGAIFSAITAALALPPGALPQPEFESGKRAAGLTISDASYSVGSGDPTARGIGSKNSEDWANPGHKY